MRNSDADIAIDVLAAADQAEPASAKASGYQDRMRVEYRDLTAHAHARFRAHLPDQPVEQAA